MKKGPIVLTVPLALVAVLVLAPTAALAERFHVTPPPVFHGPPAHSDSPVVYDPPVRGTVSVAQAPQPMPVIEYPTGRHELRGDGVTAPYTWVWIPNPPPPPMPSVIEYPTGRYELRGDGGATPYTWVWIPNPPPPPQLGPPSEAPASSAPPADGGQSPARRNELYRWTDEQGLEHWTDRWDAIPEQYRDQAKRSKPS